MKNALLAISFVMWGLTTAFGAVYYVAPGGDDAAVGSSDAPWRTIQKAANTVVAGDTVRVRSGNYPERVTESTDGGPDRFITYVADDNVVVYGFSITGDYIRVIGFEITHPTNLGYAGISVNGASHVELLDNNIHNTSATSISPSAAHFLVIRGNIMNYSGSPGNNSGSGRKTIDDAGSSQTNVLIEYNIISHTTDYVCPNGAKYIVRNNVMGPTTTTDFGGTPHVDGWQANAQTHYGFMEANWHVDNAISDSHFALIEAPVSGRNAHFTAIKNVSLRSGDQLWFQMRDGTNLFAAHNTVGQVGYGPRGGPGSSGFYYIWSDRNGPSTGNAAFNNVYTNVTRGTVYTISSGSSLRHSHDLIYPPANDLVNGTNGDIEADPQFVDYGANNVLLRSTSPARDSGGPLTMVTSASGAGNSFTVDEADWFHDGFEGLAEGHKIYVGDDNNLTVTDVNYATRRITVDQSFSWTSGDGVGYAYLGVKPDRGAYEFGSTLLIRATIAAVGDEYSVTPTGDARFVIFYQNGIPQIIDSSSPFRATISGGGVTAKAYALHPQAQPVVVAVAGDLSRPAPPQNPRVVLGE
jgi:hypothetical protein